MGREARRGSVVRNRKGEPRYSQTILGLSVAMGDTRPTSEGIVTWLEEKARRAVKEHLHLDEQEAMKLTIESEIKVEG